MTTEQLLEEASKFITGFAHSAESGFERQKRALKWLREYEKHTAGRALTATPPGDENCPSCSRPMESHSVRTPDQRTRIITCPL
jgi:hypothetical protein